MRTGERVTPVIAIAAVVPILPLLTVSGSVYDQSIGLAPVRAQQRRLVLAALERNISCPFLQAMSLQASSLVQSTSPHRMVLVGREVGECDGSTEELGNQHGSHHQHNDDEGCGGKLHG